LIQEPYKGLHVADISLQDVVDIAETRIALDVLATRCIYEDKTGERLNQVKQAWEEYKEFEFDPDPFVRHEEHVNFHKKSGLPRITRC